MKKTLIIISFALLSGCNLTNVDDMKAISQSETRCEYKKIKVSDVRQELSGGVKWIASCNNNKFSCHYDVDKQKSLPHRAVMSGHCKKMQT